MIHSGNGTASVSTASNASPVGHARDELVGAGAHACGERAHPRRREAGLHELAVARVIGRIGVHHRGRARVLDADLERQDSLARAERFGIAGDRDDVGVLRHRPVAELRVPRERRLAAQPRVVRERIAGVEAGLFECRGERLTRS